MISIIHRGGCCWALVAGLLGGLAAPTLAQQATFGVRVELQGAGFSRQGERQQFEFTSRMYKTGLWAPVYLTIVPAKEEPHLFLPRQKDGTAQGVAVFSVPDGEGDESSFSVPFSVHEEQKFRTIVTGYLRPGGLNSEFAVTLYSGGKKFPLTPQPFPSIELSDHLYLTLGGRLPELHEALIKLAGGDPKERQTRPRYLAYEGDAGRLPTYWFGYEGVDLLILTTDNAGFLTELLRSRERMTALAGWVRRGGRLLIGISPSNQDIVHQFLQAPTWQPLLPLLIEPTKETVLTSSSLQPTPGWIFPTEDFPASVRNPRKLATLRPSKLSEVLMQTHAGEPILTRLSYGRGNITLAAFDLDKGPLVEWKHGKEFWKSVIISLAPLRTGVLAGGEQGEDGFIDPGPRSNLDLGSQLHRHLDEFDVPMISFGWVAAFIFLYILVVGPLEYIVLKRVFKRLELTWITFPVIVLSISVVAYLAAYALKGNDLRINKIDLVDIDLRTGLDGKLNTDRALVYGTTWFALLSPRLQNYTIGLEPVVQNWVDPAAPPAPANTTLSWFGRPEAGGRGFASQRAPSLFRRAYEYAPPTETAPAARGVVGVPIPAWTTRAFVASWETTLSKLPITADLIYEPNQVDQIVTGKITSHLPFSLEQAYLFYGDKYYTLEGGLKGKKDGSPPAVIDLRQMSSEGLDRWGSSFKGHLNELDVSYYGDRQKARYNPLPLIKAFLFPERTAGQHRNHLFRMVDQSWRLRSYSLQDRSVRTAMLVGYVGRAAGTSEQMIGDNRAMLATHLWLGELPGEGKERPALSGSMIQDTYIRVLLPVRPKE